MKQLHAWALRVSLRAAGDLCEWIASPEGKCDVFMVDECQAPAGRPTPRFLIQQADAKKDCCFWSASTMPGPRVCRYNLYEPVHFGRHPACRCQTGRVLATATGGFSPANVVIHESLAHTGWTGALLNPRISPRINRRDPERITGRIFYCGSCGTARGRDWPLQSSEVARDALRDTWGRAIYHLLWVNGKHHPDGTVRRKTRCTQWRKRKI